MPNNTKVFVTNKGAHDFSDAEKYGELVYCTEGIIPKYSTSQMTREFQELFKDSTPKDYILLTSLTTLCSIACSVFAVKHGRLNLLIFKDYHYVVRKILLTNS